MTQKNEKPEKLRIEYWPLGESLMKRWAANAKKHDIVALARSIQRHGFRNASVFDVTLGAFVEGNGRVEALSTLKAQGVRAPAGIQVRRDGEWLIPVQVGVNSVNEKEARAFAVDANNLVLGGGSFAAQDAFRLWNDGLYELFKTEEELPITFESEALKKLILARAADPLTAATPEPGQGNGAEGSGAAAGAAAGGPEPSHIRMVQLFLTVDTLPQFQGFVEQLGRAYSLTTHTDIVMECLRRAIASVS